MPKYEQTLPEGFVYQPEFLSSEEENSLLEKIESQPLSTVIFHGYEAKRKAVAYGVGYDFETGKLTEGAEFTDYLIILREKAGDWAKIKAEDLVEAYVQE